MHMALVCYVSFSRIGILTRTENGPGTGLSRGNEFYVIRAIETWSLVNQSQEYYTDLLKSVLSINLWEQNFTKAVDERP
jgi:hypothetical protein